MKWLLSYPRSGNHLARVWLEALTGRPTASLYPGDPFPMGPAPPGFPRDDNAAPRVTKVHRFVHVKRDIDRSGSLLLLLRNPRACIASDARHTPRVLRPLRFPVEAGRYLRNCADFLDWPGPKLLMYYEDMVARPQRSIEALGAFVGADRTTTARCARETVALAEHGYSMLRRRPLSRQDASGGANPLGPHVPLPLVPQRIRPLLARYGRAGLSPRGSGLNL
jgi:hypothetical protein